MHVSIRTIAYVLGGVGVVLLLLANLEIGPGGLLTILSAIAFIAAAVLFARAPGAGTQAAAFGEPGLAHWLFSDTRSGMLWLPVRLWLGWQWLESGLGKLNNPKWVGDGSALQGYWTNAVRIPEEGRPPISYDWYRTFIQFMLDNQWYTWFAKLIAVGELLVGLGLIVGAFVGIAAFFGGLMNWSFIMAGSASTNGLLFLAAVLLILAWKVAGYFGADRFLLPRLGVPWRPGSMFSPRPPASSPTG
jgi:thiosulfate dehydrogenase (quinone) large subunit